MKEYSSLSHNVNADGQKKSIKKPGRKIGLFLSSKNVHRHLQHCKSTFLAKIFQGLNSPGLSVKNPCELKIKLPVLTSILVAQT